MSGIHVGRTKHSAVPAIARHLPERRCGWSGLPTTDASQILRSEQALFGNPGDPDHRSTENKSPGTAARCVQTQNSTLTNGIKRNSAGRS